MSNAGQKRNLWNAKEYLITMEEITGQDILQTFFLELVTILSAYHPRYLHIYWNRSVVKSIQNYVGGLRVKCMDLKPLFKTKLQLLAHDVLNIDNWYIFLESQSLKHALAEKLYFFKPAFDFLCFWIYPCVVQLTVLLWTMPQVLTILKKLAVHLVHNSSLIIMK